MERLKTGDRQEQIINIAVQIINRRGYSGLSIREIAKLANISEAAIYKHFTSKDEIILGIMKKLEDFEWALASKLSSAENSKERLSNFILFHLEMFEKTPEITSVIFSDELLNLSELIRKKLLDIMKRRQNLLKVIIEEGQSAGEIKIADSEDIAVMIQGFIRLIVFKWRHTGYSFPLVGRGKKFILTLEQFIFSH